MRGHTEFLHNGSLIKNGVRSAIQLDDSRTGTHCARSLSGVHMITRSTRLSAAAATAAAARASSASNSTIGQTTTPAAKRTSSSNENCVKRSGSIPSLVL